LIRIFYRAATGGRKTRNLLTPAGAVFFFGLVTLFIVAALRVDRLLELPKLLPTSSNIIVSVPILAIGLFLMIWSVLNFVRVKGTPVPFNPPPKLVTAGPYAHVRNPMLTGVFVLLFGFGVLLGSISLVSIFTPLFILFNVWELKAVEEKELEKRLGEEYIEYRKRVPMFIPRLNMRTRSQ
jgi:protein-S-isoprenylcysteine O-methyltransferase Ste14